MVMKDIFYNKKGEIVMRRDSGISTNTLLLICIVAISASIVLIICDMQLSLKNMYDAISDAKTVSAEETIGADEGSHQYLSAADNEQTIRSTQEHKERYVNLLLRCILSFAAMMVAIIGAIVVFKGNFFSHM